MKANHCWEKPVHAGKPKFWIRFFWILFCAEIIHKGKKQKKMVEKRCFEWAIKWLLKLPIQGRFFGWRLKGLYRKREESLVFPYKNQYRNISQQ